MSAKRYSRHRSFWKSTCTTCTMERVTLARNAGKYVEASTTWKRNICSSIQVNDHTPAIIVKRHLIERQISTFTQNGILEFHIEERETTHVSFVSGRLRLMDLKSIWEVTTKRKISDVITAANPSLESATWIFTSSLANALVAIGDIVLLITIILLLDYIYSLHWVLGWQGQGCQNWKLAIISEED